MIENRIIHQIVEHTLGNKHKSAQLQFGTSVPLHFCRKFRIAWKSNLIGSFRGAICNGTKVTAGIEQIENTQDVQKSSLKSYILDDNFDSKTRFTMGEFNSDSKTLFDVQLFPINIFLTMSLWGHNHILQNWATNGFVLHDYKFYEKVIPLINLTVQERQFVVFLYYNIMKSIKQFFEDNKDKMLNNNNQIKDYSVLIEQKYKIQKTPKPGVIICGQKTSNGDTPYVTIHHYIDTLYI